jgi:2-polyprenyl-3-methyl-5-hydroxy-6-metoxy-1,4-benzoquinol methylase
VLDIGCGQDKPLLGILRGGPSVNVKKYVGVDLNKIRPSEDSKADFYGEFNFVERWKELKVHAPFDVVVNLEVIEHMNVKHGAEFLKGIRELLKPGGLMILSTPCYDGVHHAANHIHEYTVPELQALLEKSKFKVCKRYGTFIDIKHYRKPQGKVPPETAATVLKMTALLEDYLDNDALSCFFAPLFPDHARNNLWLCSRTQ